MVGFPFTQDEAGVSILGEQNERQDDDVVRREQEVEETEEEVMLYSSIKVTKPNKDIGEISIGEDEKVYEDLEISGEGADGEWGVNRTGDREKVVNKCKGYDGKFHGILGAPADKSGGKGRAGSKESRTPKVIPSNTVGNREERRENGDKWRQMGEGVKRHRGSKTPKRGDTGEKRFPCLLLNKKIT